ncbi:MAG: cytochrome c biogenesis protein CcdA [Candidatus Saccharibacteria bacterium]|nr:cytochrome c biogenesis protein CcdA [Candidatus Saccharibacteria bacterium]
MGLLIASLLAGVFSVLAPCVLPLLPVMIAPSTQKEKRSVWWLLAGLGLSIIIFSILLKSTTALLSVPAQVWSVVSGVIIILFGITLVAPQVWEWLMLKTGLALAVQKQSVGTSAKRGRLGDMLFGASLGPIFSVCSPTYALIVAVLLPADPLQGMLYLLAYVIGLLGMLALVAVLGRRVVRVLGWGLNPHGLFRRVLGVVLIILGILVVTGLDKTISSWLVSQGWFDWQVQLESWLAG